MNEENCDVFTLGPMKLFQWIVDGWVSHVDASRLFRRPMGRLVATVAVQKPYVLPGIARYPRGRLVWPRHFKCRADPRPWTDFLGQYRAYILAERLTDWSSGIILDLLKSGSPAESTDKLTRSMFQEALVPSHINDKYFKCTVHRCIKNDLPDHLESIVFYAKARPRCQFMETGLLTDILNEIGYRISVTKNQLLWRQSFVALLHAGLPINPDYFKDWDYRKYDKSSVFHRTGLRQEDRPLGLHLNAETWLRAMFERLPARRLKGMQYYNPFRRRMRHMVHWRRAVDTRRDAGMVFRAASEGRPLELARRLRLGKLAGGHHRPGSLRAGAGFNALTAACVGGHGDCVRVLARGLIDADEYLKGRDAAGRGCWEVAKGDAVCALQEIREDPWMLCEDLPG